MRRNARSAICFGLGFTAACGLSAAKQTSARDIGRQADTLDYGARCDGRTDDSAAFAKAAHAAFQTSNGSVAAITIPAGTCVLASPLRLAAPTGGGVSITGAGADISVLEFTHGSDGVVISLDVGAGASVAGLTIRRSGGPSAGNTALAITETGARSGAVSVRDIVTDSTAYPGSWAQGIVLRSTDNAAIEHVHTIAGFPPEPAAGLVIEGIGGRYAVDTSISDSKFQGGETGILVRGFVQGVLASNIFAIAGRTGLTWIDGEENPSFVPELLEITNAHFNASAADLRVHGLALNLSGSLLWRWPDGQGNATPWTAIELSRADSSTITANTVNGGNGGHFTGAEQFLRLTDSSAVTVSANTVLTINGPAVQIDGSSVLDQITGNVFNGVRAGLADSTRRLNPFLDNTVNGHLAGR